MNQQGFFQGKHYTAYLEDMRDLILLGHIAETEHLLLALLDVIEAESNVQRSPLPPWCYK
jgi:hypothetical protein